MTQESAQKRSPPWIAAQTTALLAQRGHACLLHGPSGLGQVDLALGLAHAWLCEQPNAQGACGYCASCHAIDVRTHADLLVLMPEVTMLAMAWPLPEKAQEELDANRRKPSRDIRIDAMREAISFTQRTTARGRGKVVLVYPAERMNAFTANALLKTLEEPPGDCRFVLASESVHQLLPTIRSRCLGHVMRWPTADEALAWLIDQGIERDEAGVLLKAAGGRVHEALGLAEWGLRWGGLPKALAQGDVSAFKDCNPAQIVDILQKVCHDMLLAKAGSAPRFFAPAALPAHSSWAALTSWARALSQSQKTCEHPLNAGLMLEALVSQAQLALNSRP